MQTYQQFLNESMKLTDDAIKKFISLANSKCNKYLMAARGQYCYRGMEGQKEAFANKKVRKDRKPLDMEKKMSARLDDAFNEVFGIRARSQCLFVTGNENLTLRYGPAYIVFPIGKIQWIWSKRIKDLFNVSYKNEYGDFDEDDLEYWVKENYTKNQSLDKAIKAGHEIMIDCKSYCGIAVKYYDNIKGRIR